MSEAELIEKARQGDRNAFRAIVEEWQGFAYSIAYRFTGNHTESEDLAQETFIRLWNNLYRYNMELNLKPWLGRIVTNLCLDFLKSARAKHSRNTIDLQNTSLQASNDGPEQEFNRTELQDIIRKLAASLTPRQQSVFVLRDLEDLDVDEVTRILQLSGDVVKSNLYYARMKIREGLRAYYGDNLLDHDYLSKEMKP
jgi:RNA polymerase sigma-70 factor (ECF subfamily)